MFFLKSLFCATFLFSPLSFAKVVDKTLASVSGQPILLSDLKKFKSNLTKAGLVDEALSRVFDLEKVLNSRPATIEYLVNQKILEAEAKRMGLSVSMEQVNSEIKRIAKSSKVSVSQLRSMIEQKGISFTDYQDFIKSSLERRAVVQQEITSKIQVSEDDITTYYITHKGAANPQVFEYKLAQILLLKSNGGKESAKQRAEKVYDKLSTDSFEAVADKFSEDPSYSQGGVLGEFKSGEMISEMQNAVSNLLPGQHSVVFESRAGFHIVKVLKKNLVENPQIQREKMAIQNHLMEQLFQKRLQNWLKEKRKALYIRVSKS